MSAASGSARTEGPPHPVEFLSVAEVPPRRGDSSRGARLAPRQRRGRPPDAEALVEGRMELTLRDEDLEGVASALADMLLARALADEAREAAS